MRGKKLLATLALSAVLFAGCGLKSGEVIIKVNDKTITQGQFDQEFITCFMMLRMIKTAFYIF